MNDLKRASRKGKKKNKVKEIWKRLRKNKSAMLGLFVLVFFSLVAIFAGAVLSALCLGVVKKKVAE